MDVYAVGCSMTWGHGMKPDAEKNQFSPASVAYAHAHAWPARLGARLGCAVENDGLPGGSNDRIVRRTIDRVIRKKPSLVVVGWTEPIRREVHLPDKKYDGIGIENQWFPLHHLVRDDDWVETWKREGWNDTEAHTRFFNSVLLLSSFLRQQNVPYLFFTGLCDLKDWETPSKSEHYKNTKHLFHAIDWNDFVRHDSLYSSVQFRFVISNLQGGGFLPCWHPNELGHDIWAEALYNEIKARKLIPNKA